MRLSDNPDRNPPPLGANAEGELDFSLFDLPDNYADSLAATYDPPYDPRPTEEEDTGEVDPPQCDVCRSIARRIQATELIALIAISVLSASVFAHTILYGIELRLRYASPASETQSIAQQ